MLFRGEVHSHTGESDGSLSSTEAMTYARDTAKADFFSVTEHSHYISDEVYEKQKSIADNFEEPGRFAALYGWEMTWNYENGWWGHMNVLGAGWIEHNINEVGLPALYDRFRGERRAVAMFNHPGTIWGNFDEYAYRTPAADRCVCLSEIKGEANDRYSSCFAGRMARGSLFNEIIT